MCLALMIVDAIMRFNGRKLGVTHSVRFIWFIYGTACVWAIGSAIPFGYRGFNDDIFRNFFEEIYDAYWGSKQVRFFKNTITVGGAAQDDRNLVENGIFFETIVFIILRIVNVATCCYIVKGSKWANLWGTLRRIVGLFLALFSSRYGLTWYQYIYMVGSSEAPDGRTHFNVWLSWAVSIYVHIECLWSVAEVAIHLVTTNSSTKKSKHYNETSTKGTNPSSANFKPELSYESYIDEVTFMHQDKKTTMLSTLASWYNFVWLLRWVIYLIMSITWYN